MFRYDKKQQEGMLEFCFRKYCIHDTRATHTSPRAPVSIKMRMPPDLEEFWLREHDAQVAKAARERVLDALKAKGKEYNWFMTIPDFYWEIESLRGAQEEQE
jgi:hypothetical protein